MYLTYIISKKGQDPEFTREDDVFEKNVSYKSYKVYL